MTSPHHRFTFHPLPLGAVRPDGWLRRQLRLQADGLTGHIEELWPDLGPDSGWLGGDGESWERGPYYLDGLVPLAYLLDDATLIGRASMWIEWMLASQREDGQFGPANDDWWPRMVAAKALVQYAEVTGDERVLPFLLRYFAYQHATLPSRPLVSWGKARSADNALSVLWAHERTGEEWLLELARTLLTQGDDWGTFLTQHLITGRAREFSHLTHGPNVAMGLKYPAVRALLGDQPDAAEVTRAALANLDRWHGQVHGVFSGDEWLGGREAVAGVETCQVVELLFSLSSLVAVLGDGRYGDLIELVGYNLLPASSDARMLAHQYHQQANQIEASIADRPWTYSGHDANTFGLEPHFGCCTANYHQGWPKLVRSLWFAAADGLVAAAYGPSVVRADVGSGVVEIEEVTDYPFSGRITLRVRQAPDDARWAVYVRVPEWAGPELGATVAGGSAVLATGDDGFARIERAWKAGDEVVLDLPLRPRRVWRERQAVGVRVGPLVMVHSPGERWRAIEDARGLGEWEVLPRNNWNIGLAVDGEVPLERWEVSTAPVPDVPFQLAGAPLTVAAMGNTITGWTRDGANAGTVPEGPVRVGWLHAGKLVPYGCARVRIAEFPTVVSVRTSSAPWASGA